MSGSTSRRKGKRGERELAKRLTSEGFDARRGAQHRGGPDSPDVLCPDLPSLHFEVKRTERLRLYDAVAQAQDEAGDDQLPVVAHRRNRHPWVVVLPLDAFLAIVRESDLPATSAESRGAERPEAGRSPRDVAGDTPRDGGVRARERLSAGDGIPEEALSDGL